jgi:hypothetical protein
VSSSNTTNTKSFVFKCWKNVYLAAKLEEAEAKRELTSQLKDLKADMKYACYLSQTGLAFTQARDSALFKALFNSWAKIAQGNRGARALLNERGLFKEKLKKARFFTSWRKVILRVQVTRMRGQHVSDRNKIAGTLVKIAQRTKNKSLLQLSFWSMKEWVNTARTRKHRVKLVHKHEVVFSLLEIPCRSEIFRVH